MKKTFVLLVLLFGATEDPVVAGSDPSYELHKTIQTPAVGKVAFLPGGKFAVSHTYGYFTPSQASVLTRWSFSKLSAPMTLLRGDTVGVEELRAMQSGKLVVGTHRGSYQKWDLHSNKLIQEVAVTARPARQYDAVQVSVSGDGKTIVSVDRRGFDLQSKFTIKVWNANAGKLRCSLVFDHYVYEHLRVNQNGTLAFGHTYSQSDQIVRRASWDLNKCQLLYEIPLPKSTDVEYFEIDPLETTGYQMERSGGVTFFRLSDGKILAQFLGKARKYSRVIPFARQRFFNADGTMSVHLNERGELVIIDLTQSPPAIKYKVSSPTYDLDSAHFSPDGSYIMTVTKPFDPSRSNFKRAVELWRSSDGSYVELISSNVTLESIHFSDDGKFVIGADSGAGGFFVLKKK